MKSIMQALVVASAGTTLALILSSLSWSGAADVDGRALDHASVDCDCDANTVESTGENAESPTDSATLHARGQETQPRSDTDGPPRRAASKLEAAPPVSEKQNSYSLERLYHLTIRGHADHDAFFNNRFLNPERIDVDSDTRNQFVAFLSDTKHRLANRDRRSTQTVSRSITKHIAENNIAPTRKVDTSAEAKLRVVEAARKKLAVLERRGLTRAPKYARRVKTLQHRISHPEKFVGGFGKMRAGTIYHMDGAGNIFELTGEFAKTTIARDGDAQDSILNEYRILVCGWFASVAKTLSAEQARRLAME